MASCTHPDIIENASRQIFDLVPDCRLLYIVRDPIKRLESDWRIRSHEGWGPACINEAIKEQDSLVTHGLYWNNISVYRELFSDEQILVSFLEDYSRSPESELARCLRHIGVEPKAIRAPDFHQARNQSADMRKDGFVARFLRDNDVVDQLRRILPQWVFQAGKRLTTAEEVFSINWDDQLKTEVRERLIPDSKKFLEFYEKPADFWDGDGSY